MNDTPAIAVLELSNLPQGTCTADAMTKRAQLAHLRAGSVQPGKYVILVGGEVGAVQESYVEGLRVGGDALSDHILLPDAHEQVAEAVQGARRQPVGEALGIFESMAIPATVAAADRAVKAAAVEIIEIRLGDGLGGKAVTYLSGRVHDVQAALAAALESFERSGHSAAHCVIPSAHADIVSRVAATTMFHVKGAGGPVEVGGF
jgi:microcompartment protein CcmL/EutN